jgi:hypothetical protein
MNKINLLFFLVVVFSLAAIPVNADDVSSQRRNQTDKTDFLLRKIKALDSLNGVWARPVITELCDGKLADCGSTGLDMPSVRYDSDDFWKIGMSKDETNIVVNWKFDQCSIGLSSLKKIFGEGTFIPTRLDGCLVQSAWLTFRRSWGRINCLVGAAENKQDDYVVWIVLKKAQRVGEHK